MSRAGDCDTAPRLGVQLLTTLAAALALLGNATGISWGIVAARQLQQPDEQLQLTPLQTSWLLTSLFVGSALGAVIGGKVANHLGPRVCMLVSLPVTVLSYIVIFFSQHFYVLLIGRLIGGVSSVMPVTMYPLYVGSCSSPRYRGGLLTLPDAVSMLAIAGCVLLGQYWSWRWLAAAFALFSTLPACLLLLLPDDPTWLLTRGRTDCARIAADRLHVQLTPPAPRPHAKHDTVLKQLRIRKNFVSLTVGCFMMVFTVFSGYSAIFNYALVYFEQTRFPLSPAVGFTALCLLRSVVTCLLVLVVDRLGRRWLMIASAAGMALSYLCLVAFFSTPTLQQYTAIPLALILLANLFYCLGLGPITWCLVGEIFPSAIRQAATSGMTVLFHLLVVLQLLLFPALLERCGQRGLYLFHSLMMVVAVVFFVAVLPETSGLSLPQTETIFERRHLRFDSKCRRALLACSTVKYNTFDETDRSITNSPEQ